MADNTEKLVTLNNLSDHIEEIKRILKQVRAFIDKKDDTKVDKVSGKGLSTNDLTTELLNKLNSLENYDDTAVRNLIKGISSRIDTLVGESASEAIDNFNEILAFLNGVSDTQTLQGLISNLKKALENQIATKANKSHTHAASDITDFTAQVKTLQAADILSAEPTESTLTHTVNGTIIDYKIGELVRVPDSESETGYKFYQLHAITDGKATWATLGTGSGGNIDLTETVTISLASNQSSSDSSLVGTSVLVEDITNGTETLLSTTWQGSPITIKITAATLYRVTFGTIEGYQTPDAVQYTAQLSSTRSITATYNTCVLSVAISGLENGATAQATVSYNSKSFSVSSGVSIKVPIGTQVSVSVPTVSCHITPSSQTFTPDSTSKSVSFAYVASKVKVSILSNQSSDTTISAVEATISYGSTSVQATNGSVVYIPHDQTVTVTFPAVDGYKTPSAVAINNTSGGQATASGIYQTEIVTVTVSADNGTSMSGRTVTIGGTQYTYAGSAISKKIPFGTSYSVSCSAYDGYNTPATQTFTASQAARSVAMVYVYNPIVYSYITIDQGQSGESAMISGDVQGEAIQAIRNGSHLYLGKQTASGKQLICQLSDTNGTQYSDGTAAALDGTEGDHWLRLPEFYWKRTAVSGNQTTYGFAFGGQPDSTWKKWDSRQLLGVHEAYVASNKLYSRSGVTSGGNLTLDTFKAYARNRGTGYSCVTWEWHCMMAMLFYVWYGRMNSQAQCGTGSDTYLRTLGTKDSLGMTDTTSSNGNADNTKFWGIENWWGDKYEWIDNADVSSLVWTITNIEDGTTRNAGTAVGSNGWITKTMLSECMDLIPTSVGGSETTYFCDYYYCNSGVRVVARSCDVASTVGGVACVHAYFDSSSSDASIGSRLAFIGEIEEAGSVAAYKAASSIG